MTPRFKRKLFLFYKERYEAEAARREKSTERLTFSLLILTLVANASLTYLEHLPPFSKEAIVVAFYIGLLSALLVGAFGIYFYVRAMVFKYNFSYMPSPEKIAEFLLKADAYNATSPPDPIDLEQAFDENLSEQYKRYSTENSELNDRRSTYIYKTSLCSIASMVLLLVCAPIFFLKKPDAQKIEVVKPVKVLREQSIEPAQTGASTQATTLASTWLPDRKIPSVNTNAPVTPSISSNQLLRKEQNNGN